MRTILTAFAIALIASASHAQDMMLPPHLQQAIMNKLMMQSIEPGAGPATTSATSPSNLLGGLGGMGGIPNLSLDQQNALATHAQAILNRNLTVVEKNKLTEFQTSPEGQSIIGKLPKIAEELAPILMQAYLGQPITPAAPTGTHASQPAAPVTTAPAAPATNFAPTQNRLPLTPAGN